MKLVEIKDVRPGQIRKVTAFNQWKDEEEFEVLAVIEASGLGEYAEFDTYAEFYDIKTKQLMEDDSEELRFYENGRLIGKLGITHRIEDNRLVEIQPVFKEQKINTDDIVKILEDDSCPWVVVTTYNAKKYKRYISLLSYHDSHFSENEVEKIGILGVTHEFVNDREAANE